MNSDALVDVLWGGFPGREFVIGGDPNVLVTVRASQPQVGDLTVEDGGDDELTVAIGTLTHGHFACYDDGLSRQDRQRNVIRSVAVFLRALFEDRVLIWSFGAGAGGGWRVLDAHGDIEPAPEGAKSFLWSGPYLSGSREAG